MNKQGLLDHSSEYVVSSLSEYVEIVSALSHLNNSAGRVLWYRGHEKHNYTLLPSLLRGSKGSTETYGLDQLREEFRYQHFRAKCNQLIESRPDTRIEWHEIMQHHFAKTRLMDWSESAITALLFSLEAFIDPLALRDKDLQYRRSTVTPTIWVLDPIELNRQAACCFYNDPSLLAHALEDVIDINYPASMKNRIITQIDIFLHNDWSKYMTNEESLDSSMAGIVCLSALETERSSNADRIINLMYNGQYNPYFYLYLRYYNDGLPIKLGALPPLAINHPYHSRRIQAQRGVFTIFPNYIAPTDRSEFMSWGASLDLRGMELQMSISRCLNKIRIIHPTKVASELRFLGEQRSSLYPELEVYAKEMENFAYPC